MNSDSPAWVFYCYISFAIALIMMLGGIVTLNADLSTRAYFVMGTVFLVGTSITLTKTMRDQHEQGKMVNRIEAAKTEKLLHDYHAQA
jgi:hypothetical protein